MKVVAISTKGAQAPLVAGILTLSAICQILGVHADATVVILASSERLFYIKQFTQRPFEMAEYQSDEGQERHDEVSSDECFAEKGRPFRKVQFK